MKMNAGMFGSRSQQARAGRNADAREISSAITKFCAKHDLEKSKIEQAGVTAIRNGF